MQIDELAELDAAGFLAGRGESEDEYLERIAKIRFAHAEFASRLENETEVEALPGITVRKADAIPRDFYDAPAEITGNLYGFATYHVPGFFLSRQVGLLWGGCLIGDTDRDFSLFLLRETFRTRKKWLFYRRDELLAHELCHSARQALGENTLEEFFAYQTSPSALRRKFGNCFINDRDAVLFVVSPLLLLAAEILRNVWFCRFPSWIFWLPVLIYPAYLLMRNQCSIRLLKSAKRKLEAFGVTLPLALLFRCTREEMSEIASLADTDAWKSYVDGKAEQEVRWRIIGERFAK